jgi:hypothetical protein
MARRQRRYPAEPVADFGAQPWRVTVEDAPDPDAPNRTLRRARAYDPLRRMDLDPALVVAADRFRQAYLLGEAGVREGAATVRLDPWQRCHYFDKRADARAEYVASVQAVGKSLGGVFIAATIGPLLPSEDNEPVTVRRIESELGIRHGKGADLITEALERLRDWQTESGY